MLNRAVITSLAAFAIFASAMLVTPATAAMKDKVHQVVIHVDDNDPKRMNMVLNNAATAGFNTATSTKAPNRVMMATDR